uniref:Uncharacterized protein n=1 Tax=Arundo donax TaxID=35708 RepID=A0A0A9H4K8_ARUDO
MYCIYINHLIAWEV